MRKALGRGVGLGAALVAVVLVASSAAAVAGKPPKPIAFEVCSPIGGCRTLDEYTKTKTWEIVPSSPRDYGTYVKEPKGKIDFIDEAAYCQGDLFATKVKRTKNYTGEVFCDFKGEGQEFVQDFTLRKL
jgi:hypothetical protein